MNAREINVERASLAQLAAHVNKAAALADDSLACGQAKAGAFAARLGRKEGLEKPRPDFLAHSGAVVVHGQHDVFPGDGGRRVAGGRAVEAGIGGLDGQHAAVGHGVARVDDQVHQHLPHMAGVGLDASGFPARLHDQHDVFVN